MQQGRELEVATLASRLLTLSGRLNPRGTDNSRRVAVVSRRLSQAAAAHAIGGLPRTEKSPHRRVKAVDLVRSGSRPHRVAVRIGFARVASDLALPTRPLTGAGSPGGPTVSVSSICRVDGGVRTCWRSLTEFVAFRATNWDAVCERTDENGSASRPTRRAPSRTGPRNLPHTRAACGGPYRHERSFAARCHAPSHDRWLRGTQYEVDVPFSQSNPYCRTRQ